MVLTGHVINCSYPLVLTEKSETVGKAFRRYVHTGVFILQLYSDLPWDQVFNLQKFIKEYADFFPHFTTDL
jgi:hypothetical protein